MFCPKCGNLIQVKEENGKKIYICTNGHEISIENHQITVYEAPKQEVEGTIVIEEDILTLPKTKVLCPKCGNTEAYWILRQTRSADEGETRYFICTKCRTTWREY